MKQHKKGLALWLGAVLLLLAGALLAGSAGRTETVQEAMRDAVLHDVNRISLFGLKDVNPGLISAFTVTALLLAAAAGIRIFLIPKFRYMPGRFQMLLEEAVGLFSGMARDSSPHLRTLTSSMSPAISSTCAGILLYSSEAFSSCPMRSQQSSISLSPTFLQTLSSAL